MNLSYRQLLEQALDITLRYKFLWFLGLFLFITQGSVIQTVQKDKEKEPVSFKKVWSTSKRHVFKIITLNFAALCISLFSTGLLLSPPYYLSGLGLQAQAVILTVLAFIILVPVLMVVFFSAIFGAVFVTLGNMSVGHGLRAGFELFIKRWFLILPLALFTLFLNAAFGFLSTTTDDLIPSLIIMGLGAVLSAWQTVLFTLVWFELTGTEKSKNDEEKLAISEAPAVD